MFRFVAVVWNSSSSDDAEEFLSRISNSEKWSNTFRAPGLAVFHADARSNSSQIYLLPRGTGVILGKLFGKEGAATITTINPQIAAEISSSRGRSIVEGFWGRYVAVLYDPKSANTRILRDPIGALPCFVTIRGRIKIYFSRVSDLEQLGLSDFSVNWKYLFSHISFPSALRANATGLNEVQEIQPGECSESSTEEHDRRSIYWDPTSIAQSDPIKDAEIARRELRAATSFCVRSWGECYPRILHLLSGGFDSTVVLNCLSTVSHAPEVTCLNYFHSASKSGDERDFARVAASTFKKTLIECEEPQVDFRASSVLSLPKTAKPPLMQYYATHSQSEHGFAEECNASAIFYGVGGDQIFYQGPLGLSAVDFAFYHRLGDGWIRQAERVAAATRVSFWTVIRLMVRGGLLRQPWNPLLLPSGHTMRLVSKDVVEAARKDTTTIPPWYPHLNELPWGKIEHMRMMMLSHDFYNPIAPEQSPERVRPLVSQPLIEIALKIPTYILTPNARERGLARDAFRHDIPEPIFNRRSKGTIDQYLQETMHRNAQFLREFLLDGILVRERILDQTRLEKVFSADRSFFSLEAAEIVAYHAGTEAWLRRSLSSSQRAAA